MARRSGRTSTANSAHLPTPEQTTPFPQPTCLNEDLAVLRTQWKWAAFGQFITTFSTLLNIADVTVTDVENDLVHGSRRVIPRIMQRLLYTLSYDRKISIENWQSALRKQYMKRNPLVNPLGLEPPRERDTTQSREETPDGDEIGAFQGVSAKARHHQPYSTGKPSCYIQEPLEDPLNELSSEVKPQLGQSSATPDISRAATQDLEDSSQPNGNQASIDWFDLPLLVKLDSLHVLTEWQFQNPTRLRTLMRSDDELATWRYEPVGYDSKKNAYWLIGGDRLWIQRTPPKPPKSLKRKRPAETRKAARKPEKTKLAKRQRTKPASTKTDDTPSRTGRGRAAKLQAKIKLDAQAKELAELNRQARGSRQSTRLSTTSAKPPPRSLGTRVSARLRGVQTNEWQSIPDEWLNESSDAGPETHSGDGDANLRDMKQVQGDQDDSVSELTELSDDSDDPDTISERRESDEQVTDLVETTNDSVKEEEVDKTEDTSFVEWETICVTLEEWEHIAERFEKATHYLEKALYKYLVNEVVPSITQTLRELEKKKRTEEALVHRKRSSRIAIRESEREEARLAAQRQAEEEEKMSRTRRLEARRQREEEERLRREQAREQRRKEREAREMRRQTETGESANTATLPPGPSQFSPKSHKSAKMHDSQQRLKAPTNGTGSRIMNRNDWELDCEICRKRGVNVDDGTPMMSCGKCYKWQHITCHDQADERAGRAKRNWDVVEFICQQCRSKMFASTEASNPVLKDPRVVHRLSHGVNPPTSYHNPTPYQTYVTPSYAPTQPASSTISTLYHAANGSYSHYPQPYGDIRTSGMADRYPTSSQPYVPMHHYNQHPSTISFSHYQPREGGFSSGSKAQPAYQVHHTEMYDQDPRVSQHTPYSDLRSGASQRSTVSTPKHRSLCASTPPFQAPPPTQTVWSIATPPAGTYTTPYQNSGLNNVAPRRDIQLQPNLKAGSSSSPSDFNQQPYPNTQFRYHSTT
ncbi:hypothetical protein P691DRAFT_795034 [Macrolepiota fuliginosa MF-IS2]|uniref:Zinc finger PHD-type domain-containing protein n=1 Tax=Macrolepiota fuliginosa MF-IS2 TaxID=1400762 RepID=A0A9P5XKX5_9AGAR|nr:hypothetical protein P691DRAFT_795034 [Macrolepiota fuliginosa MF-IS2]